MTIYCKYCDQEIKWVENSDGKWIATDPEDSDDQEPEWHYCAGKTDDWYNKRRYCFKCDAEIYFTDQNKSPRGKFIPMDAATENPHRCEKSK